jgi:Bacteriophage tail sheath protein
MPSALTYPGVYVEEVPSGVHTIIGVATSITAFVGRAARGPVDEAVVINSFADYGRIFGGLSLLSTMSFAVRDFYLNRGSQAVIVRVQNGAGASRISLPAGSSALDLDAASPGSWGDNLSVIVDHNTKTPSDTLLFNLTVFETDPATKVDVQSEVFLNVSVDPASPRFVAKVLEQGSVLVDVRRDSSGNPIVPNVRPDETLDFTSPPASPLTPKPRRVKPTATGSDGADVGESDVLGNATAKTGIFALETADLFNLLCVPPLSFTTDVSANLLAQATAYCVRRRAMLIVDPPSRWTTKDAARTEFSATSNAYPGLVSPDSSYAALFFPRLRQPNPLHDDQVETFAPCGALAGVFARTDATRGVWKAPAGQDAGLVGVPQLSVSLTDDENGELNPLGINCLRAFPIIGRVSWGARTLDGADRLASEWKYIPVRRTALFIEESLYRGTKWVVFEPNDEPLWAQIRLNVGAFMQDLFRQGAFQGDRRSAYFVKCDKETTTQNDIDKGIVNILVGFAPLKPAEFVVIKIQQIAGQIQT